MIKPTIGRVVLVQKRDGRVGEQAEVVLICYVHGDRCINVAGFDANGAPFALTSLTLVQEGDEYPSWTYAEWMPYQKGQAAKTEELERRLTGGAGSDRGLGKEQP